MYRIGTAMIDSDYCNDFKAIEVESIEKLVSFLTKRDRCFTLNTYKPTEKCLHGHRRADSYDKDIRFIGVDMDDGSITKEECELLFNKYEYFSYSTKSDKIPSKGYIDRFRIILPLSEPSHATPDMHKEIYEQFAKHFKLSLDKVTGNCSRLWFFKDSNVKINHGEKLILNDFYTKKKGKIDELIKRKHTPIENNPFMPVTSYYERGETDPEFRMERLIAKIAPQTIEGNLKTNVWRVYKFAKDIDYNPEHALNMFRNILQYPNRFNEEILHRYEK